MRMSLSSNYTIVLGLTCLLLGVILALSILGCYVRCTNRSLNRMNRNIVSSNVTINVDAVIVENPHGLSIGIKK